jgi:hypothetical protein
MCQRQTTQYPRANSPKFKKFKNIRNRNTRQLSGYDIPSLSDAFQPIFEYHLLPIRLPITISSISDNCVGFALDVVQVVQHTLKNIFFLSCRPKKEKSNKVLVLSAAFY